VLAESLKHLLAGGPEHHGRLRLDAFKLSHHGSMGNVNEDLLSLVECPRWIVSTNGDVYHHPDRQTAELVARSSRGVPEFLCNCESRTTLAFADTAERPRWHTRYPGKGVPRGQAGGILVDLAPPTKRRSRTAAQATPRPRRTSPGTSKA
jgi:hypothetical protein